MAASSRQGSIRVTVGMLPAASRADWKLEVRDASGRLHVETGNGEREFTVGSLPVGRLHCALRAAGFVGDTRRLEVEEGREAAIPLTLRQFGRVSGTVRCEGVPVAGALVRLDMPMESAAIRMELVAEDRIDGLGWSVESDGDGRYRFDRVLPGPGLMLVVADFDHAPAHTGPIEVHAGEETRQDLVLTAGTHLAGRIIDLRGVPCRGETVNILQKETKGRVTTWNQEARVRTDDDGRFVTPALDGAAMRMLQAWIAVDGIQQVIQHETSPPESGTKDVGTLAPHPGTVLFEAESAVGDVTYSLTVAANGDPPGVGQSIVLSGAAFDRDGRIRLAGLPIGEGFYSVLNAEHSAVADGTFRTTGADIVVRIPPFRQPAVEPPPPAESLVVEVADPGDSGLLVLIADGNFVMWKQIEKGNREPVVERVSPGTYTLLLISGDRFGRQEITQREGHDLKASIAPDREGRAISVSVLHEGKPVPGASIRVRGFRRGSRGLRAPWAEADSDGRAVLRGVPPDITALTITVLDKDGSGRTYSIGIGDTSDVTVDLAKVEPVR